MEGVVPQTFDFATHRTIMHSAPTGIVYLRRSDLRIIDMTDVFCEFVGRTREELVAMSFLDLLADPSKKGPLEDLEHEGRHTGPIALTRPDGSSSTAVVVADHHAGFGLVVLVIVETSDFVADPEQRAFLDWLGEAAADMADYEVLSVEVLERLSEQFGIEADLVWDVSLPPSEAQLALPIHCDTMPNGWFVPARVDDATRGFYDAIARRLGWITLGGPSQKQLAKWAMFQAAFENTSVGMQLTSPEGRLIRVNEAFARMLGYERHEIQGRNWREFTHPDHPHDDLLALVTSDPDRPESLTNTEVKQYLRADGSTMWAKVTVSSVYLDVRRPPADQARVVHVVDVTDQVEMIAELEALNAELRESKARYQALTDPAPDPVMRIALDGMIVDANKRVHAEFEAINGQSFKPISLADGLKQETFDRLLDHIQACAESREPIQIWRLWLEPKSAPGAWVRVQLAPEIIDDETPVEHVHVVISNVTELVENELRLANLALVDPLTDIANRAAVFDRLRHALDRLRRPGRPGIAVASIDLDHFKAINDTYGHLVGDDALVSVARALEQCTRVGDTVGRLGGDEFVVLLEDVESPDLADELGHRIIEAIDDAEIEIDGLTLPVSASVGIAWTDRQVEPNELLARADRAMYQAKLRGRGRTWVELTTEPPGFAPSSASLLRELAGALARDEFELHYQPIIGLDACRTIAFEALLRWRHPAEGLLLPNRFLTPLMQSGQIGPVGHWALRTAARQLREWQGDPVMAGIAIHVNATPAELAHPAFAEAIRREVADAEIDPALLVIEVTEVALEGTIVSSSALAHVASTGVRLSLDDFGTGVSSLSHLRTKPLHGVKIDRSFISGAHSDTDDRAIVEAVLAMASHLDLEVVAEGVETAEQLAWLKDVGCAAVQGWYFSKALTAPDAMAYVKTEAASNSLAPG